MISILKNLTGDNMTVIGSIQLSNPALAGSSLFNSTQPSAYEVRARTADGIMLAQGEVPFFAKIALSCLIEPEPGDRVLASPIDGTLWVTTILSRSSELPLKLLAATNLHIAAPNGTLTLSANSLAIQASRTRLLLDDVLHIGRVVTAHIGTLKLFGSLLETLVERVLLQAKRSFRLLEETDHLRANNIDYNATSSMSLLAENTFITAENTVRVDANQIHMG